MKSYLLLLVAILLFFGCKQDNEILGTCSTPPVPSVLDYIPLKVGNYWVYDWMIFSNPDDSNGAFFVRDTLIISGLEEINGLEYFRMERSEFGVDLPLVYWRDSLGYLVDETGRVIFTAENNGSVFDRYSPGSQITFIASIESSLASSSLEEVEVPAGLFYCLQKEGKINFTNPEDLRIKTERDFIAPGLGFVKGVRNFLSGNGFLGYELLEYHLE